MSGLVRTWSLGLVSALTALLCVPAIAAADTIRIGGTTSVRESGLLASLEAGFRRDTGDQLQFIVGGTGRVGHDHELHDVVAAGVGGVDLVEVEHDRRERPPAPLEARALLYDGLDHGRVATPEGELQSRHCAHGQATTGCGWSGRIG